ncbi:MAG: carbon-nitrogen hydrolase family protein [Opitutae bacterium]|nr:carbon-nitrogen hydrolase family protein [Opitutae bacterium]
MSRSVQRVRAAVVQHPPVFLHLELSVARACALTAEAARAGAELVVFPESWLPGYPVWLDDAPGAGLWGHPPATALYRLLSENSLTVPGPHFSRLLACAKENRVHLVMGAHERDGGTLYNTMLFLSRDGVTHRVHRKLMPTYTERLLWGQGDGRTLEPLPTEFGPLGGLVCWEHWMPLARAAMHAQHETVHVAQWPTVREMHLVASRHYAFEGRCFVLAAGTVLTRGDVLTGFRAHGAAAEAAAESLLQQIPGDDGTLLLRGGSAIIAPDGDLLAGPLHRETGILHAELDLALITDGHLTLDTAGHYARPDVFQLTVNTRPPAGVAFSPP